MLTKNDLLVLSFLLERPMHGYEINQAIKAEQIELWFEISTASVYYSLNKLKQAEMIAESGPRSNAGEKTIYHITPYGREQFFAGTEALLGSTQPIRADYDLGIFVLNRLPRARAAELLAGRVAYLQKWRGELELRRGESQDAPLRQAILDHAVAAAQLDVNWLAALMERLQAGAGETDNHLMTFQGDLQNSHLTDLIKLVSSGSHSGTLVVSAGLVQRSLTFERGHPHCAASRSAEGIVVGPEQVLKDIYDLFGWRQGAFTFDQRGCVREGCVSLDLDADALILGGARRLDNWDIIQRIIPASAVLFEAGTQPPGAGLVLSDVERAILQSVDGHKDVTTLAWEAGLTEFETCRILYGLYAIGLIQRVDPDKSRLRRVFREFAELLCRSALPYRTPEEASLCEQEVNQRCAALPVRLVHSHIEDNADGNLPADQLADIYRTFLKTQWTVLGERLGKDIADELHRQALNLVNPDLRETLERYTLV